jgi:iron complex outermembrane receptor protein
MKKVKSAGFVRLKLLSGATLAVIATPSVALAQSDAQPDAAAEAQRPPSLEDIVVTARRRAENLQKVPISVSVLSAAELGRQNIVSPADLTAHVPSLAVFNSSVMRDSAIYAIRGQGQAFGGSEPAVITYVAEVPTITVGPGYLFDLENIQVLKGPQGTLFGRNTTGGAVLLQPTKPGEEFGGYVAATAGDYDLRRIEAGVNIPIVADKVLTRFSMDLNRRDGYTKDVLNGREYDARNYKAFRFSLILRPVEGLENYTLVDHTKSDGTMGGSHIFALNPGGLTSTAFPGLVDYFEQQKAYGPRKTALDPAADYQKIRTSGVTNITTWEVSDGLTVKNVFGYRLFKYNSMSDVDGTPFPIIANFPTPGVWGSGAVTQPSTRSISDEFQLQGKALEDRLNWIAGVYFERRRPQGDDNLDRLTQFGFEPFILQSLKRDSSRAAFAQGTYEILDGLKFTGGLRYTKDKRQQTFRNYLGSPAVCLLVGNPANCEVNSKGTFDAFTWNLSLDYQITPRTLVYATSRRGYKSGGFNAQSTNPDQKLFGPEYVNDYEIGMKTEFNIGMAPGRVNFDLFRGDFKDLQVNGSIFDVDSGQALTVTANAGRGYIQGAEIEGLIEPVPGVTLSGFYAYTDPKYKENLFFGVDLRNVPFSGAPKHKFSVTGAYETEIGGIGKFDISATYSYQTRVYFTEPLIPVNTDPQRGQKAYGLLNLSAGLHNVGGSPLDLSVFITNATNKTYKTFEYDSYDVIGSSHGLYGEPRMFGAELRFRFGADADK